MTGNFGKKGGNNLHAFLLPILGHTDERVQLKGKSLKRTAYHGMHPIAGIYPPNILPDEIELAGEKRVRAVFVDSANPLLTYADTGAYERAFQKLDLLVVVDVAMTETARFAHYVLPAASQFEKWEATGFNLEFPDNAFHLRHPLFPALGESLPEPEIYTRLLEAMRVIPRRFPVLEQIARHEPDASAHLGYLAALGTLLTRQKRWVPYAASIVYRTLGKALPNGAAAAAPILPLAIQYAQQHTEAVRRAGHRGNRLTLGTALFRAILRERAGVMMSRHQIDDVWSLMGYKDKKIQLIIPEMLDALHALETAEPPTSAFPLILMAGERRSYNANQIYRDPAWRKVDPHGSLRMHPDDAALYGLSNSARAQCRSATGMIEVVVELDDSVRRGMVTLPHGYGMRYQDSAPIGPELNRLTASNHCDPLTRTPYHKYVPVSVEAL